MTLVTYGPAMYETETKPNRSLDQLVSEHASLVKRIAHHLKGKLPDSVLVDDLIQSGMIGLFEAAKNYDATKGASFETYAGIRIRGAMLDEVRKGDWIPRSVHRNSRRISDAVRSVESKLNRDAKDNEIAEEMEISLEEYHHLLSDSQGSRMFSFEELMHQNATDQTEIEVSGPKSDGMLDAVVEQSLHEHLVQAIKSLPEREQLVLSLYYDEELNLKEIGEVLGVTESRVSQIHSQAALRLKSRLQFWTNP